METEIIVAIIGAIGVIVAAIIAAIPQKKEDIVLFWTQQNSIPMY